jgi:hypothetical protein
MGIMRRYGDMPSGAPSSIAKLVYISNFTRTYGRYIELVDGIINQLITGGYHIVG